MFWEAIEQLHRWERENLPGADTPQGSEVLIWLLKCQERPRPLKNLYRSSRFSEPTIRACLKAFIDKGFVVLESNGSDLRNRYARGTPKLHATVRDYQERFKEIAALAEHEGIGGGSPLASSALGKRDIPEICLP